ncbi:MAG: ComEA family DNA-binding protein [Caldisericota bacterium]|nr:ComEA family DNA-binding protein [Caldisericota bacterium]
MKDLSLKQWISVVVLVGVVMLGIGMVIGKNFVETEVVPSEQVVIENSEEPIYITSYVVGAVNNPDVYELPINSIVKDAIEKAGGPTEDADLVAINLARKVKDGEEIIVPAKQVFLSDSNDSGNLNSTVGTNSSGKININTASAKELEALPGIGEVKSKAIVQYRKDYGLFRDIRDIMNVSGIGEITFENIKDLIVIP